MNRIINAPKGFVPGENVSATAVNDACKNAVYIAEKIIRSLLKKSKGSVRVSPSLVGDAVGMVFKLPSFLPPFLQKSTEHISNGPHLFAVYVFTRYMSNRGKSMVKDLLDGKSTSDYFYPFFTLSSSSEDIKRLVTSYETLSSIGAGNEVWLNTVSIADVASYSAIINWMIYSQDPYVARLATYLAFMQRAGCSVEQAIESVEDSELKNILLRALAFSKENELFLPISYLSLAYKESGLTEHDISVNISGSYDKYKTAVENIIKGGVRVFPAGFSSAILFVNFGGVESYLSSFWRLKDYAASSALVDILVSSLAFSSMDSMLEGFLPHESLIIMHGGHSDLLFPAVETPEKLAESLKSSMKDLWDVLRANLEVSAGYYVKDGVITYNYSDLVSKSKFYRLKAFEPKIYSYGLHRACDNCGSYPATHYYDKDKEYLCEACFRVRRFSEYYSMGSKIGSSFILPLAESLTLNPEEYEGDDPMKYIGKGGYVTVVKFDGNDMGKYFRSEDLLSYASKSYFLYWEMMKAYSKAVKQASERCSSKVAHRIVSGTIYLAGDEGVLVLPPDAAPGFLADLAENIKNFSLKMGALTVKAEHPFSVSVEVCESLMKDAKVEQEEGTAAKGGVTTVAYLISEGGITPASYSETFSHKQEASTSRNPYSFLYSPKVQYTELRELLADLEKVGYRCSDKKYAEDFSKNLSSISNNLEKLINGVLEELKKDGTGLSALVYAYREALRTSDKDAAQVLWSVLRRASADYFSKREDRRLNLLWYLFVLKSMRRGQA
mgnify:CR=1 FL=1